MNTIKLLGIIVLVSFLAGCTKSQVFNPNGTSNNGGSNTNMTTTYRQIERLGRPAINEGLVITNDYLNAFNSIDPKLDLSPAAAPVVAEAGVVLTKVRDYGISQGKNPPAVGDVVAGFLPDVMRIDTSKSVLVGQWAYNSDAVIVSGTTGGVMLTGGRKIEDDVIDVTLSYLITKNAACGPTTPCDIRDEVSYAGGTDCTSAGQGTNSAAPGHKCLAGQIVRNGNAVFPFLGKPN